jgi:chaperonin GroEL (HSP60 family)
MIRGTEDVRIGVEIVRRALEEPLRMIAQNDCVGGKARPGAMIHR